MGNNFSYLKNERESRERRMQERMEQEQAQREKAQKEIDKNYMLKESPQQALRDAKSKYDGMITSVLVQLKDAAYPGYKVQRNVDSTHPRWEIFDIYTYRENYTDYGVITGSWEREGKEVVVDVDIEVEHWDYENNNTQLKFICRRHPKTKGGKIEELESELTQDALIQALIKLHPPEQT